MLVALAPIVAFGVLLAVVTVPYVSLGPGPTFNTIGVFDGKKVVDIKGADVHETKGHLDMTTVSQRDGLTLGQALTLWMSGREQLVPRDLVYPPEKSKDEIDEANTQEFKRSEDSAEYAALGYLKYASAVTVETVNKDGASTGKLKEGDAIDAVNGTPVSQPGAVSSADGEDQAGRRGDSRLPPQERAARHRDGQAGLCSGQEAGRAGYRGRRRPVGAVHHRLQPGQRRWPVGWPGVQPGRHRQADHGRSERDKFVAGTGTIDADGKVGSIGGITHKIVAAHDAGASVFLVPADNCDEAQLSARKRHGPGQGGEPRRCGGRAEGAFSRWRSPPLLTGTQ